MRAGETLTGVEFAYQWVRSGTDIDGATSSTYTVTDEPGNEESVTSDAMAVAAALRLRSATLDGATLTLTYNDTLDSFVTLPQAAFTVSVNGGSRSVTVDYAKPNGPDFIRDTQGRVASSFSGRAVSNDTPATALTDTIHGAPESHDGQEDFTFELRFSEEPKTGFSYETLRDHAFTVTRGTVEGRKVDGARRLVSGSNIRWEISVSNIRWEISVSPDSNGDITVVLPITEDCTADAAMAIRPSIEAHIAWLKGESAWEPGTPAGVPSLHHRPSGLGEKALQSW